MRLTIIKATWL